jgi:uncharacterized protein (TIGR03382 family)
MKTKRTTPPQLATQPLARMAGLALSAGLLGSVLPAKALACSDGGPPPELVVVGQWPEGDADRFYADDVIHIGLPQHWAQAPLLDLIRVEVVDEADGSAVAGQLELHPLYPRRWLWWRPTAALRVGGRYHYAVFLAEAETAAVEATFEVVAGPQVPPALADVTATWCVRSVPPLVRCGSTSSCDDCYDPVYGPPVPEYLVSFDLPGFADSAHAGRWVELRAAEESWSQTDLWRSGHARQIVAPIPATCVDLRLRGAGTAPEAEIQRCAPVPIEPCSGSDIPDGGVGGVFDSGLPDGGPSGALDAGVADAGEDRRENAVAKSDGCQASPGAPGVPLAAGFFALLLGLGRRRRR